MLEADEFQDGEYEDAPDLAQALYENQKASAAELSELYCLPFCAAAAAAAPQRGHSQSRRGRGPGGSGGKNAQPQAKDEV